MPRLYEMECAKTQQSTDVTGLKKHSKTDSGISLQFIMDK